MKKKLSTVLAVSMIATNVSPAVNVFADEIKKEKVKSVENFTNIIEATKATVSRFDVYYTDKIEAYDNKFKMSNDNIESITNNGGQYASSALKYAIDGDLNTHWETGKANSDTFTNEVVFDLKEATVLNRIAYKGRNGNKGFAKEFEIWGSTESEGDNFTKVS